MSELQLSWIDVIVCNMFALFFIPMILADSITIIGMAIYLSVTNYLLLSHMYDR